MHKQIPISVYIHFPWCIKKCPYCDFNSHAISNPIPQKQYYQACIQDFNNSIPLLDGRKLQSIFIGGGTPSLIEPLYLQLLLEHIQPYCHDNTEVTMEVNPGSFEIAKFQDFFQAGINRLSIGVQSFNEYHLKKLGRVHNSKQAIHAVTRAQDIGFDNINIDIMHSLPSQTIEQAKLDIQKALDLNIKHISYYQLTLEPNTYFHLYPPQNLPNHDITYQIEKQGKQLLHKAQFLQYEISAYAKIECKHNLNYWKFGDYLGIGAGAHGKITTQNNILRTHKNKQPQTYISQINKNYTNPQKILTKQDIIIEFMLGALRLYKGFNYELFYQRTGLTTDAIEDNLSVAVKAGLIDLKNNTVTPSDTGRRFLNNLLEIFLPR